MKYIIALLFCYTISISNETSPHLLKKVVVGGNKNATLGQVIAGYSNGFHIGIRIPSKVALSVGDERIVYQPSQFEAFLYPNPTDNGSVYINAQDVKSIQISDVNGKIIRDAVNYDNKVINLSQKGAYLIRITNTNNLVYSTTIIFN